jgi:hypothetical protein
MSEGTNPNRRIIMQDVTYDEAVKYVETHPDAKDIFWNRHSSARSRIGEGWTLISDFDGLIVTSVSDDDVRRYQALASCNDA